MLTNRFCPENLAELWVLRTEKTITAGSPHWVGVILNSSEKGAWLKSWGNTCQSQDIDVSQVQFAVSSNNIMDTIQKPRCDGRFAHLYKPTNVNERIYEALGRGRLSQSRPQRLGPSAVLISVYIESSLRNTQIMLSWEDCLV